MPRHVIRLSGLSITIPDWWGPRRTLSRLGLFERHGVVDCGLFRRVVAPYSLVQRSGAGSRQPVAGSR